MWLQGRQRGEVCCSFPKLVGIWDIYIYISLNRVRAPKAAALCHQKWKRSQLASVTRGAQSKHKTNMLLKEAISQGDFNILKIQILRGAVLTQVWRQRCIYFNCIPLKREDFISLTLVVQKWNGALFFPVKSSTWSPLVTPEEVRGWARCSRGAKPSHLQSTIIPAKNMSK